MPGKIIGWLTNKDNREAVLALLAVVTAVCGGGWFLYDRLMPANRGAPSPAAQSIVVGGNAGDVQQVGAGGVGVIASAGAIVTIGYTIEQHEERLARREAELRTEMEGAHSTERERLLAELDEVRRQMGDAEASFATRKAELARAIAQLDDLATGLPEVQLEAARRALAVGDTEKADALFAEVQVMEAAAIGRAAAAAFERGRLAEADVRWADAALHYNEAARLAPSFEYLHAARELAWRSGDYRSALRSGEDLLMVSVAEHGTGSVEHSVALNDHALTLQAAGRFAEAEPLFRDALAISNEALGKDHPYTATNLNNLALLLHATGRFSEAEPLFRDALAITETAFGRDHPQTAASLNNLALLLQDTGRFAEAEPFYREALATTETALGRDHPQTALNLNNLAALLHATGHLAEAEPLYREALSIRETVLGRDHPETAANLDNLALLLHISGRFAESEPLYREALAINETALGKDHPDTQRVAANLASLLAEQATMEGD